MNKAELFKQSIVDYLAISILSLGWFLILPLRFVKPSDIEKHQWQWFGGYHGFWEEFFIRSPGELIKYANQHSLVTAWQVPLSIVLSFILGVITYFVY